MADLLNVLDHKKNTKVLVNGTVYDIGADGVVKDLPEEAAAKLLQNSTVWKAYDPKRASALRQQAKAAHKGKMQLLDVEGNPLGKLPKDKPGEPMDPVIDSYERAVNEEPPPVVEEEEVEEEVEEEESDVDWPEPSEDMAIDYLREMAEAYEVTFTKRMTKKTLVKRINEAMYE